MKWMFFVTFLHFWLSCLTLGMSLNMNHIHKLKGTIIGVCWHINVNTCICGQAFNKNIYRYDNMLRTTMDQSRVPTILVIKIIKYAYKCNSIWIWWVGLAIVFSVCNQFYGVVYPMVKNVQILDVILAFALNSQSLYRVLCAKLLLFFFLAVTLGNNRLTRFQCGLRMRLLPKQQLKILMRHPITVLLAFQAFRE